MIAVDTSVVVRYLTGDPPRSARRARTLLEGRDSIGLPIVVLLETGHVLRTQYGVSWTNVLDTLLELITRQNVEVLGLADNAAIEALARARTLPGVPLADALVVAAARDASAESLASFDRGIGRHGINVIVP